MKQVSEPSKQVSYEWLVVGQCRKIPRVIIISRDHNYILLIKNRAEI